MKANNLLLILVLSITFFFFKSFLLQGLLPIPSDTIVGLYHPFRDLYAKDYPNGIPYKNFLITDPVRQQYPWRNLSVDVLKRFELPLWNPYSFAGTPLLGNLQSAPFYPLNILFLFFPFEYAWSIQVLLQPLLAGIFLYLYLRHIGISKTATALGVLGFALSGFSVAWLEWNTVVHTALWLPLILLSIDKSIFWLNLRKNFQLNFKIQKYLFWSIIFIFSLVSSFFAGHLQIFFYVFISSLAYFFARWIQHGRRKSTLFLFIILSSLFIILSSIQWVPTIQFIQLSSRSLDQSEWTKPGWFIPWQHLIQFIVPDFFGNPTTLNYWGVWNYGEFIGYVGILPLIMGFYAMFWRRDRKTLFFGTLFFLSLLFSLPTIFAKLPFILNFPFVSTSQPTRLLFVTDFSLSVLAALGFDFYFRTRRKDVLIPFSFFALVFLLLWSVTLLGNKTAFLVSTENFSVARRNLIFPSTIFSILTILILSDLTIAKQRITTLIIYIIIVIVALDLLRFGLKFNPFVSQEYLFPNTKTISFLQKNLGHYRFMTTDSRIFPPNFSIMYKLQSVDGYDPLYLRSYAELIAASERGKPNIDPPFGFNRIITPHNYDSRIIDLLGVKYVLSLSDLNSPKLKKVFQEGQTRVYENKDVLPRAFFVKNIIPVSNNNHAVQALFTKDFDIRHQAVFDEVLGSRYNTPPWFVEEFPEGSAEIIYYSENKVLIKTSIIKDGFLVFTDSFYTTWKTKIYIQGQKHLENTPYAQSLKESGTAIFRTDYNFRGILVPAGDHIIEFSNNLL